MLRLLKQEHNQSVPVVYGLVLDEGLARSLIRNWISSIDNEITLSWFDNNSPEQPFAIASFRGGLEVNFFLEVVTVANENDTPIFKRCHHCGEYMDECRCLAVLP